MWNPPTSHPFLTSSFAIGLVLLTLATGYSQEESKAKHEELRKLREAFTDGLNSRDFNTIKPLLTDTFTFTAIDNRKLTGVDEMEAYWKEMFEGEQAVLESVTVSPGADALTEFIGDDAGIAQGTSNDTFKFKKVGERKAVSRWTAVVQKVDGAWKLARIHMSGSVLDNPVLQAQKSWANVKAGAALLIGLVVGFILKSVLSAKGKNGG